MERGIDELSRVLGGIEKELATVGKTLAEDRVAAASYRTDIRREIGNIQDSVQGAISAIEGCKAGLDEMRPKVLALEHTQLRGEGAAKAVHIVVKIFYSLLALAAGLAGGYFGGHIASR